MSMIELSSLKEKPSDEKDNALRSLSSEGFLRSMDLKLALKEIMVMLILAMIIGSVIYYTLT